MSSDGSKGPQVLVMCDGCNYGNFLFERKITMAIALLHIKKWLMMLHFNQKKSSKKWKTKYIYIYIYKISRNKELRNIPVLKDKAKLEFNNYCHSSNTPPLIILLYNNKQNL